MKILIVILYGVGVFVTVILSACVISRSNYIPFPDAMLPIELHELAQIWLAIGFLPMIFTTILFRRTCKNFSRVIFLPSLICAGFLLRIVWEVFNAFNG